MGAVARIPSPYHQGYLDAQAKGTYIMSDGISRLPPRRYGIGSDAHEAFMQGVMDNVLDRTKPTRTNRTFPKWALI